MILTLSAPAIFSQSHEVMTVVCACEGCRRPEVAKSATRKHLLLQVAFNKGAILTKSFQGRCRCFFMVHSSHCPRPYSLSAERSGHLLPHRTEENCGSRSHKQKRQRHQSPLAERGDGGCVNFLDRDADQSCLAHRNVRFEPELRRQVHDVRRVISGDLIALEMGIVQVPLAVLKCWRAQELGWSNRHARLDAELSLQVHHGRRSSPCNCVARVMRSRWRRARRRGDWSGENHFLQSGHTELLRRANKDVFLETKFACQVNMHRWIRSRTCNVIAFEMRCVQVSFVLATWTDALRRRRAEKRGLPDGDVGREPKLGLQVHHVRWIGSNDVEALVMRLHFGRQDAVLGLLSLLFRKNLYNGTSPSSRRWRAVDTRKEVAAEAGNRNRTIPNG